VRVKSFNINGFRIESNRLKTIFYYPSDKKYSSNAKKFSYNIKTNKNCYSNIMTCSEIPYVAI